MPRKSPYQIALSVEESAELNRRAAKYTLPYFEVVRAKMILMAAAGIGNDEIAWRLDTRREVVSQWRKRFFEKRLAGLEDGTRPGRPPVLLALAAARHRPSGHTGGFFAPVANHLAGSGSHCRFMWRS